MTMDSYWKSGCGFSNDTKILIYVLMTLLELKLDSQIMITMSIFAQGDFNSISFVA